MDGDRVIEEAVPQGFKRTEVGVIPEDWSVQSLGECLLTSPEYGINAPAVPYSPELPTYVRITDITEEGKLSGKNRVSVDDADSGKYALTPGDLVFARTGASVGKSYLHKEEDGALIFAGFLIRIKPDRNKLYPAFIANYTTTSRYWSWIKMMSARSGQPGVNGEEYAQLPIPLPPLSEQRAIAEALSNLDNLISSLDRLLAKKRAIKTAVMQQLLTGMRRLPGFSEEWEVKRLGDVSAIKTGKKNNEDKSKDGRYPFFVRSQTIERINTYSFDGEAILVPGEGGIGSIFHYVNGKFDYHQRVYKISNFSVDTCGKYIYYSMLQTFNKQAMRNSVKATVDSLRLPTFLGFEFLAPAFEEQTAIATVLSDMDAEIDALEARREKTQQVKQGMMQELLTGKTRLI